MKYMNPHHPAAPLLPQPHGYMRGAILKDPENPIYTDWVVAGSRLGVSVVQVQPEGEKEGV